MIILRNHVKRLKDAKTAFEQEAERTDLAKEVTTTFYRNVKPETNTGFCVNL